MVIYIDIIAFDCNSIHTLTWHIRENNLFIQILHINFLVEGNLVNFTLRQPYHSTCTQIYKCSEAPCQQTGQAVFTI